MTYYNTPMRWDTVRTTSDTLTRDQSVEIDRYYRWIAENKVDITVGGGFAVDPVKLHPCLFPHQRDTVMWMLARGKALNGSSFGMGKTRIQIEVARQVHQRTGGKTLTICPLAVKSQFAEEDGPVMGVRYQYVRTDAECEAADTPYLITNYERVREGDISAKYIEQHIECALLDEGSVLRSLGSKTQQTFSAVLTPVPYVFVSTATPSPNNYKEIIYYADALQVMDSGQALTRWFKRDSTQAGNLTIHPHLEKEFWMWVASWALFVQKPSDLGYSDDGYTMPPLKIYWHRVTSDHEKAWEMTDAYGQAMLFKDSASSIQAAIREKRDSLQERIDKAAAIVAADDPSKHWLIWHHLEDERRAITKAIADAVDVYGSQELEIREQRILDFAHGRYRILATKPEIAGSGCNFQRHCYANIFVGVRYQFEEFIQAIHRTQRYGQTHEVEVHIIYTDAEDDIVNVLRKKWAQHEALVDRMTEIIKQYGLTNEALSMNLKRSIGVQRQEVTGAYFTAVNNDNVTEMKRIADNSVDFIHTSVPFDSHYEYVASKNDFGHNGPGGFWGQMDFLIPELYRVLKPGRVAAIHVKDLIYYSHKSASGMTETHPFSDETVVAFRKHGFVYMPGGRITITTDVVRENNTTYRLTWTEQCKDGSKMGAGMPEYVLLFRKPPTDLATMYADEPVVKTKDAYSVARWQIDAHSFWRSNGNRPLRPDEIEWLVQRLTPEQVAGMNDTMIYNWYKEFSRLNMYDYHEHVAMAEELDDLSRLPKTYGLMLPSAPVGAKDTVWTDVVVMHSLNSDQSRRREANHVCPLPFDIVERLIERYSQPGELVLDPFGGLHTVPYVAVKLNRYGYGIELNQDYWRAGVRYCQEAEMRRGSPSLFDLIDAEHALAMAAD